MCSDYLVTFNCNILLNSESDIDMHNILVQPYLNIAIAPFSGSFLYKNGPYFFNLKSTILEMFKLFQILSHIKSILYIIIVRSKKYAQCDILILPLNQNSSNNTLKFL